MGDKLEGALRAAYNGSLPSRTIFSTLDPSVTQDLQFQFFDKQSRLIRPVEVWFKQRRKEDVVVTPFGILGKRWTSGCRNAPSNSSPVPTAPR